MLTIESSFEKELLKLEEIKKNSYQVTCSVELTHYKESPSVRDKTLGLFKDKASQVANFELIVSIQVQTAEELEKIALLINELAIIKPPTLLIRLSPLSQALGNFKIFMNLVSQTIPCVLGLSSNGLGTLGATVTLDFMDFLAADPRILKLDLDNNQLSALGEKELLEGLKKLTAAKLLNTLTLRQNGLIELGPEFIEKLIALCGDKVALQLGGDGASLNGLRNWEERPKKSLLKFILQSFCTYDSEREPRLDDFLPTTAVAELVRGVLDEMPTGLNKLASLVEVNPSLKTLDPLWLKGALDKFLEKNNDRYIVIETLKNIHATFPALQDSNAKIKAMHVEIKKPGYYSWGEKIDLSSISISNENLEEFANMLSDILAGGKYSTLVLTIDQNNMGKIPLLIELINKVKFSTGSLEIVYQHSITTTIRPEEVFLLIKQLNNPSINKLHISKGMVSNPDELFSFLTILAGIPCQILSLEGYDLHHYDARKLLACLIQCSNNQHLTELDLGGNAITHLGIDFIRELRQKSRDNLALRFFSSQEIASIEMTHFCERLSASEKKEFAVQYYLSVLTDRYGQFSSYSTTHLDLEDELVLPIIHEIVTKKLAISSDWTSKDLMIGKVSQIKFKQEKSLFYILQKLLGLGCYLTNVHELPLSFSLQLRLVLAACQYNEYVFTRLDQYDFSGYDHGAAKIIGLWKTVFLKEKSEISGSLASGEDIIIPDSEMPYLSKYEEDYGVVAPKVRAITLPELRRVCHQYLPDALFVDTTIEYLQSYKDDRDSALALLRMSEWFSWFCAQLLIESEIWTEYYRADKKVRSVFDASVKEILNFAVPEKRYSLALTLIDTLNPTHAKRFFSVADKLPVSSLLPALALYQIMLQADDEVERINCEKEIIETLQAKSFSIFQGRFLRSLINTILAVKENIDLKPVFRLQLLKSVLTKPSSELEIEKAITQFLENFKLSPEDNKEFKILEEKRQKINTVLQKKIRGKDASNTQDETALQAQLENATRAIDVFFVKSNQGFDVERLKQEWIAFAEHLGEELANNVMHYFPPKKLANADFRTFQRRVLGDVDAQFKTQDFKKRISCLTVLQALANLNKLQDLEGVEPGKFIVKLRDVMKEVFSLTAAQAENYTTTFLNCHNEGALLTYYSKIQTLKGEDAEMLLKLFREFLAMVLSENSAPFYQARYGRADNQHLTAIFDQRDTLKAQWKKGYKKDLNSFMSQYEIRPRLYKPDFCSFFQKKIFGHKHLEPQRFNFLRDYLDAKNDESRKKALNAAHQSMAQNFAAGGAHKKEDKIYSKTQWNCIRLLEVDSSQDESQTDEKKGKAFLEILESIKATLRDLGNVGNQFRHDVEALMKGILMSQRKHVAQNWEGWSIVDTDHFWSLFMAGTDVEGSCQSVDGQPNLNKCLMSYVMDGKTRMLAIQNEEKITMARVMFRLHMNPQKKERVLFVEEIYPPGLRGDLQDALIQLAKLRAQELELPLLASESLEDAVQYEGTVAALGSECIPFEYVDAIYGVQEYGVYEINDALVLFKPSLTQDARLSSRLANVLAELESSAEVPLDVEVAGPVLTFNPPSLEGDIGHSAKNDAVRFEHSG